MAALNTTKPFTLTLSGSSSISVLAERGLIDVAVTNVGESKERVSSEVLQTTSIVEQMLRTYAPLDDSPEAKAAAALAHWSKTSLSSTSLLPHDPNNSNSKRQYKAHVQFDVRFKEFTAMGQFVERLSKLDHVEVNSINWTLTPQTQQAHHSQLRHNAARDSFNKAKDYCDEFGFQRLCPVALTESGGLTVSATNGTARMIQATKRNFRMMPSAPRSGFVPDNAIDQPAEGIEFGFTAQEVRMNLAINVTFHAE